MLHDYDTRGKFYCIIQFVKRTTTENIFHGGLKYFINLIYLSLRTDLNLRLFCKKLFL